MQGIPRLLAAMVVGTTLSAGTEAQTVPPGTTDTYAAITTGADGLPVLLPGHQYRILHETLTAGNQSCSIAPNSQDEATGWWRSGVGTHPAWADPGLPLWPPGTVRIFQRQADDWILPDNHPISNNSVFVHLCEHSHPAAMSVGVHQSTATIGIGNAFATSPPKPMCLDSDAGTYVPCHPAPTDAVSGFGWG